MKNCDMPVHEIVAARLRAANVSFKANDNISAHVSGPDLAWIESDVAKACDALLKALVIDTTNDHNTKGTAARLAKMFMREVFAGRYHKAPNTTHFPNVTKLDQVYTVGPISIRSTCSHHFAPILGSVWVGVVPGKELIGLSKFTRVADWVFSRPQIQEEAVVQLADELERLIDPRGLAVVVKATHLCMTWRGVREHKTEMATSVMRGLFREAPATRAEFLEVIKGQGYGA
jgi:GTP cyclohydrolase I